MMNYFRKNVGFISQTLKGLNEFRKNIRVNNPVDTLNDSPQYDSRQ